MTVSGEVCDVLMSEYVDFYVSIVAAARGSRGAYSVIVLYTAYTVALDSGRDWIYRSTSVRRGPAAAAPARVQL